MKTTLWLSLKPFDPGYKYLLIISAMPRTTPCVISAINYQTLVYSYFSTVRFTTIHTVRLAQTNFAASHSRAPNAQLFTLVHELVHLFIDDEGISTVSEHDDFDHIQREAIVNRVAAEILVPKILFEKEPSPEIKELAGKYSVSQYVIARRLLDIGMIDKLAYYKIVSSLKPSIKPRKKPSGGNYNSNLRFRIDHTFFRFVHNAIMQDKVSYTEALRLIGTSYKGFKYLEGELL